MATSIWQTSKRPVEKKKKRGATAPLPELTLGELEPFPGPRLSVFLSFLDAGIPG
jgi:hypothetical protein